MASRVVTEVQKAIGLAFDGFARIEEKPYLWYRRLAPPLYSFIIVAHSTKHQCFEVDVVSTALPTWDRQYGTHQLRRATGLPHLRAGSTSLQMEEIPYYYTESTVEALEVISAELEQFAQPWFEAHRSDMADDKLVELGMRLTQNKPRTDVELDGLKQSLRKQADRVEATKWQRREISILAHDLLRWQSEIVE